MQKIVLKRIDTLIPYKDNAKIHTEKQIENLMKSLEKFGWMCPCIIDQNNVIVVGHGRVEAAKRLGIENAECIVRDDLTDEELDEYRVIDNLLSEGGYDEDKLRIEFNRLDINDYDFSDFDFDLDFEEFEFDDTVAEKTDSTFTEVNEQMTTCPACGLRFSPIME